MTKDGGFALLPNWILKVCRGHGGALAVFAALASHDLSEKDCVWPGVSKLVELTGLSDRHVRRSIQFLVEQKCISCESVFEDNRQTTNRYTLWYMTPEHYREWCGKNNTPPDAEVIPPLTYRSPSPLTQKSPREEENKEDENLRLSLRGDEENFQEESQEEKQAETTRSLERKNFSGKTSVDIVAAWAEILAALPKRLGGHPSVAGKKALLKVIKSGEYEQALEGAKGYAEFIRKTGKEKTEFVCHAATFLNQKRYADFQKSPKPLDKPKEDVIESNNTGYL